MVLYKMLARDVNSNPTQYRTWIVADNPDLTGEFYTGPKSGPNPLVDITAYAINDPTVIAGFDLPTPSRWNPLPTELVVDFPIRKVLPQTLEDTHLAIIDGYIYLFGGRVTNKIYRASVANPADFEDTGATLPNSLYGGSLAIVKDNIYIFGGNNGQQDADGYGAQDTIFTAPVSNPLNWTDTGAHLPRKLYWAAFGMVGGQLYIFGGRELNDASNIIFTASASNPTVWTDTGARMPLATYGSTIAQIDGYWMLYGGLVFPNTPNNTIWHAPVTNSTFWQFDGYLPYATAFSQFVTMGNDGYLIGPMVGQTPFTGFTPILQCSLSTPAAFIDVQQYIRGQLSHSNIAIVYDRIWMYGGSGETAIFACNQVLKYNYYNPTVQAYGFITRVLLPSTDNLNNPFEALGIPYWKTDYSLSPPPPPPSVPPPSPPTSPPPKVPQPPYI